MGASGSKAAQRSARRFPTRAPGSAPPAAVRASRPPPLETHSRPQLSPAEDGATHAGSADAAGTEDVSPAFADRLRQMGIAEPNPIFSPSSTASQSQFPDITSAQSFSAPKFPAASYNATLEVLDARRRLQAEADDEFDNRGTPGHQGREFLDVATVRDILESRQRGESAAATEARLKLKPGVVARLGPPGVVSPAS